MLHDLRYSLRMLLKRPGTSLLTLLAAAVGIGTSVAIFSLVHVLFLRRAPAVAEPDRLVALGRATAREAFAGFGYRGFTAYDAQATSFAGLAAYRSASLLLHTGAEPEVLQAQLVTSDYFPVLGVRPAHGRTFAPEEDGLPAAHPVVVLAHDAWVRRFGGRPDMVGSTLRLNAVQYTVIGIAPRGFRGIEAFDAVDAWLPLAMESAARVPFPALDGDLFHPLRVVGRLAPGVTRQAATAELAALAARIERPDEATGRPARVMLTPHVRLADPGWRQGAVSVLTLLGAAAAFLLLIVCANLGALLLARAASRRGEVAVRCALGASRGRVLAQLLSESVIVVLAAAGLGLLLAFAVSALVSARAGPQLAFRPGAAVLLFTTLVALAIALIAGLGPALFATRVGVATELQGLRTATGRVSLLRRALVGAQVALSLLLIAGAGLLARSLREAATVAIGFDAQRLLVAFPDLELAGYDAERAAAFHRTAQERLAALPGVRSVTTADALPRYGDFMWGARDLVVEDGAESLRLTVEHNRVGKRYFETVGIDVVRGRRFGAADVPGGTRAAIVNESLARALAPHGDPLGMRLRFDRLFEPPDPMEVVGVVRDVRTLVLAARPPLEIYVSAEQHRAGAAHVLVRTTGPDPLLRARIREELRRLEPGLPPFRVESLAERLGDGLAEQRLYAEVTGIFALLALLLAAIGLYGTIALGVVQRTREIGLRMALGAGRRRVLWLVLRDGLVIAGAGAGAGLLASAALMRLIRSQLYGVTPGDPVTLAAAAFVVLAAALLASCIPAARAAAMEPLTALRHD